MHQASRLYKGQCAFWVSNKSIKKWAKFWSQNFEKCGTASSCAKYNNVFQFLINLLPVSETMCSTTLPKDTDFWYSHKFIDENLIYLSPVALLHILIGSIFVLVTSWQDVVAIFL